MQLEKLIEDQRADGSVHAASKDKAAKAGTDPSASDDGCVDMLEEPLSTGHLSPASAAVSSAKAPSDDAAMAAWLTGPAAVRMSAQNLQ